MFQMGDNLNLFDFVTLKNVVHAHLLAAAKLDAPPLSPSALDQHLAPVACTVPRRILPTSQHPDVVDPSNPPPPDPPLNAAHNRFSQYYEAPTPEQLTVAGQAFFISNGEPVPFWSFARSVYHAYSGRPQRWWDPIVLPGSVGMVYATVCEVVGWVQGRKPAECAVNRGYMAYVLADLYFDIERVRLVRSLLPLVCSPVLCAGTSNPGLRAGRESGRGHSYGRRGTVPIFLSFLDPPLTLFSPHTVVQGGRGEAAKTWRAVDEGEMKNSVLLRRLRSSSLASSSRAPPCL